MKVAIVHDYLNQAGGAERVVVSLHRLFPEAPIYTSILDRDSLWPGLADADIRTSWLQRMPGLKKHFKKYLLLYPSAIESFDLSPYDLVISSSSAFAKGAIAAPGAVHICYCHTPMRFVWDYDRYVERENFGVINRVLLPYAVRRLRRWDLATSDRPDGYIANSSTVASRIRTCYGRDSQVIHPPVDLPDEGHYTGDEPYYLVVSRLNGYKRIDLPVKLFSERGWPLVVIGDGPQRKMLEAMAGPSVRFLGRIPDGEVQRHYALSRGFILPGEEDFGITPLEANAAGRPVIAYRAGGALDTVIHQQTGILFDQQSPTSLADAVLQAQARSWDKAALRRHAAGFGEHRFQREFRGAVAELMRRRGEGRSSLTHDELPATP
jgi:glycosyltransferase involved in cell wall biosynthesis